MQKALQDNVSKDSYSLIAGLTELRDAISEYNKYYFGLDVDPRRIYIGNGTKQLIYNILELLHGIVILPTPAWLGYLPQIRFLKKKKFSHAVYSKKQRKDLTRFPESFGSVTT